MLINIVETKDIRLKRERDILKKKKKKRLLIGLVIFITG